MLPRFVLTLGLTSLGIAVALRAAPPPADVTPLTAEEIFRPAALGRAELSPSGEHLAAIVTDEEDRQNLLVFNLKDRQPTGLRAKDNFDLASFRWVGDDRLLFNVTRDKLYSWGIYTAKLDRMTRHYAINSYDATHIIGVPRKRPGHVLVWIVQSAEHNGDPGGLVELDARRSPNAFSPSAHEAVVRYYPSPKGTVVGWIPTYDGDIALCVTWSQGRPQIYRFLPDRNAWRPLAIDSDTAKPMGIDPDGQHLWVVTHADEPGYELRRYHLDTGELLAPVAADKEYDMSGGQLYFSEKTGELVGISYTQRARVSRWFSSEYAGLQATVDQAFPTTTNVLIDSDRAERRFLYLLTGPREPGTYVLLDLEAKTLGPVSTAAPWLKHRTLLDVQPVSFRTRDNVRLEGYLTLPPHASAENPVPLVVVAHGGPWVRATADFDAEMQFLASRGYAVFQPNYRGSPGYSPAISEEHQYDFRRMHDDVTDATRAMVRMKFIDPKRVAIMGGSFGGYLALTGVTFEDGLYRCAVSTCGVFDWERMIRSKRSSGRPGEYEFLLDKLGRPGRDRERLEEISPLAHVDRIRVPVLIAHGTDDQVVSITQSKKLAAALKKRGLPHETFYRRLEGHGFYNYKNRVDYYRHVDAFLAKHLRAGGAGADNLATP